MKQIILTILLLIAPTRCVRAQVCYGGMCYPQQPTAPARLVMPIESATQPPHEAHCRIHVGDGTLGSGTLISKNDTTGLVLTCSHLFDDASSNIVVEFPDSSRFGARLIDRDRANDLAALLIRRPNIEPVAVDDSAPTGVLTACGYGGNGQFRPATGAVAGAVQTVGATYPSLKIGSAVRPGDSGGGVLDRAGQLVGVVWGCRDGETYLTCGRPLRQFLDRVWHGRGERASAQGDTAPTIDWHAWRDEIDSRLTALDAKKQDRGEYLQAGDLNAYAKRAEIERDSTRQIESLRSAVFDQIEERISTANPGLLAGMSYGKLAAGALGLSGPLALAVIVAGGLAGRLLRGASAAESADVADGTGHSVKQRIADRASGGARPQTF
jgi:Trypsin-like peptidase domain